MCNGLIYEVDGKGVRTGRVMTSLLRLKEDLLDLSVQAVGIDLDPDNVPIEANLSIVRRGTGPARSRRSAGSNQEERTWGLDENGGERKGLGF